MKISIILESNFLRFLIVGVVNTIFGLVVFASLALSEMPTWIALLISNLIGMIFNFFTTGGIVFTDVRISRFPRFFICYGAIYLTYLGLINWLEPILNNRIIAMAIIVVPVTFLSYLILNYFVFTNKVAR
jgi:putative flippase GtrA